MHVLNRISLSTPHIPCHPTQCVGQHTRLHHTSIVACATQHVCWTQKTLCPLLLVRFLLHSHAVCSVFDVCCTVEAQHAGMHFPPNEYSCNSAKHAMHIVKHEKGHAACAGGSATTARSRRHNKHHDIKQQVAVAAMQLATCLKHCQHEAMLHALRCTPVLAFETHEVLSQVL